MGSISFERNLSICCLVDKNLGVNILGSDCEKEAWIKRFILSFSIVPLFWAVLESSFLKVQHLQIINLPYFSREVISGDLFGSFKDSEPIHLFLATVIYPPYFRGRWCLHPQAFFRFLSMQRLASWLPFLQSHILASSGLLSSIHLPHIHLLYSPKFCGCYSLSTLLCPYGFILLKLS